MPDFGQLRLDPAPSVDSRGRPTVQVTARLGPHTAMGDVPAGASKGHDEAQTVSVAAAMATIAKAVAPVLTRVEGDVCSVITLLAADVAMAAHAGPNFAEWGANATVPVSRALWRLAAEIRQQPLWQVYREALGMPNAPAVPRCFFNLFNGGLHARKEGETLGKDRLDVQEIMVVPVRASSVDEALAVGDAIDQALERQLAARFDAARIGRADEAGFTVAGLGDADAALDLVAAAIADAGYRLGTDVKLALDVAAGSLQEGSAYRLAGQLRSSLEVVDYLEALCARRPGAFCSIEDGLGEDDWAGWRALTARLGARGVKTVGDDLFVTQLGRLERGIAACAADAVLIKVNQNGTIGGTLAVIRRAAAAKMACIVSHRSGETLDDSIADLALAAGAWGLKAGDPQPPEAFPDPAKWVRRRKYLRLLEAEREARGPS